MKNVIKRVVVIAMMVGMIIALPNQLTRVEAAEEHTSPSGLPCTNTYRNYPHIGFSHSYSLTPHKMTDGVYCNRTRLIYIHKIECSICHATIQSYYSSECTEEHSRCGSHLVGHPRL